MARFGFGQNFGGSGHMAALASYPYVRILQERMVYDQNYSRTTGALTFTGSLGSAGADGVYAGKTDSMALSWIDWMVRTGQCSGTSRAEWTRNGPNAGRACMLAHGFSGAAVDQIQEAWREWKAAPSGGDGGGGGGPVDPYAAQRMDCATSGGTWDTATNTCIPADSGSKGLSAGAWIAIALLGALGMYGAYYVATEGK
jgi:hypothetical protein